MNSTLPFTQDLVLVGGGHAHALVLRAWGMKPLAGARVTVINPGPTAPYTGMLPGYVAGHYTRDDLEIDLVRLCRHAGARLILDRAIDVDTTAQQIVLAGRGPIGYDVASIDVGITAQMDLPGFAEYGTGAKPLDVYAARWRAFLDAAVAGTVAPQIAVIGGGVAGCELAMAMAHALRAQEITGEVSVIEAAPQITGMGEVAREKVEAALADLGVTLHLGARVQRVLKDRVTLESGVEVAAQLCIGAAGAFAHPWVAHTGLPHQNGFIEVGPDFGVTGHPALFAVGDCAGMPAAPRPKAGVFAVRAAPVLHHNLRAALSGGARRNWRPQKDYLKLISLGEKSALAEKFGLTVAGPLLWRWKDRIDRAFMDQLGDVPAMPAPAVPRVAAKGLSDMMAQKPMCGGCGAKVGPDVLADMLGDVEVEGSEVVTGPGDDAAVLRRPNGDYQVLSTDHLRAMIADPGQMARIAAVHALGDIWAMAAMPQVALAQIILPQMSERLQARTLAEITDALRNVLGESGAQLVGGHTSMGAELTIGLTVTGTRDTLPLGVAGAHAGDRLILTRPLGTGVLMAAEMQGRAAGADVAAALALMGTPQTQAAKVLGAFAHAMTDVTGFGLAGHVGAICRASGVAATLWQDALPIYAGARALSDGGIASTLAPANRAAMAVEGEDDALLYDPQTAGGLLATVPEEKAAQALDALAAAGCSGHVIGVLQAGNGAMCLTKTA